MKTLVLSCCTVLVLALAAVPAIAAPAAPAAASAAVTAPAADQTAAATPSEGCLPNLSEEDFVGSLNEVAVTGCGLTTCLQAFRECRQDCRSIGPGCFPDTFSCSPSDPCSYECTCFCGP